MTTSEPSVMGAAYNLAVILLIPWRRFQGQGVYPLHNTQH